MSRVNGEQFERLAEDIAERLWWYGLQPAAAGEVAAAVADQDDPYGWQTQPLGPGVFVHVYVAGSPPRVAMTSTGVMP